MRIEEAFPVCSGSVDAWEVSNTFINELSNPFSERFNVCDDLSCCLIVKVESLGNIIKNTDVVNDQAIAFVMAIDPIRPADRLQQGMILHRLVEVHNLEDWRIEAG